MSNNNNGDMPASPILDDWENFVAFIDGTKGGRNYGLTKREHFAAMAMQGFISAGCNGLPDADEVASYSVEYANTLLKALDN